MKQNLYRLLAFSLLLVSFSTTAQEQEQADPWQGFNRAMFNFNETLDEYVLLPVTKGYKAIAPEPVEKGVHNFFNNLDDVGVLINSLLQFKFEKAAHTTARLVANSIFGVAGLIDVATPMGFDKKDEDFGQTLGYWGVETGPYLVLPFFGPSNVRDGIGMIPDHYIDPLNDLDDDEAQLTLRVLRVIDTRAELMKAERLISGDRYTFIRDAYMQRRAYLVSDGQTEAEFKDDGF